jgi:hypothetical protein
LMRPRKTLPVDDLKVTLHFQILMDNV